MASGAHLYIRISRGQMMMDDYPRFPCFSVAPRRCVILKLDHCFERKHRQGVARWIF
jgi:hypothetical protein